MKYLSNLNKFSKENRKKYIQKFLVTLKKEIKDKGDLRNIIMKFLNRIPISQEEVNYFRDQVLDILKLLGISTLLVLPASIVIIPTIIKLGSRYHVDLIPNLMKLESVAEEEIAELIMDGKKIYVEYIHDYPEHDKNKAYTPLSIDKEGNIALNIDDHIYYTKINWITKIDELYQFEFDQEITTTIGKDDTWESDEEFKALLKDHKGIKGVIRKMKKHYKLNYSNCKTEEELYRELKADNMI